MAVAARKHRGRGAAVSEAKVSAPHIADGDDYNGMSLEEWKAALVKDVEERFGPTPDNLVSAGKAGW